MALFRLIWPAPEKQLIFTRQAEAHIARASPHFDGPRKVPEGVRRCQLLQGDGAWEASRSGGGRALQGGTKIDYQLTELILSNLSVLIRKENKV